jgi:hypothetical protein
MVLVAHNTARITLGKRTILFYHPVPRKFRIAKVGYSANDPRRSWPATLRRNLAVCHNSTFWYLGDNREDLRAKIFFHLIYSEVFRTWPFAS